jgi:hypothetical protein
MKRKKEEFRFTINKITENKDGSANCEVDMDDYTKAKLIEVGVMTILRQYIEQERKPWYKRIFKRKSTNA